MKFCFLSVSRRFINVLLKPIFLFVLISLFLISSGCSHKEKLSYDINTYLSGDTNFERNIATVMPSKEELKNSKVVYYLYYDDGGNDETSQNKMIRLTVEYSDENFINATQTLEQNAILYDSESMSSDFYYNGILYDSFIFYNNGYCAVAYHACSNSKTISYIAFYSWDLQFMDVESALGLFPQFEYKNQIVSS